MRKRILFLFLVLAINHVVGQPGFPVNGVNDPRDITYAFINATIVKDPQNTIQGATMVIRQGKITAIGIGIPIPKEAIVINCTGKFIYPSFIDSYSDYGMPAPAKQQGAPNYFASQLSSNQKGAFGWNQALKNDVDAYRIFIADEAKAKNMRELGFGAVLSHQKDGIARGTGTVVTLADKKENFTVIRDVASAHYSLNKGTSTQSYPSSMMGCIALLRQGYLDAQYYKSTEGKEPFNITLQAWNHSKSLPQIFEVNDKWNALRADRIGDEFGVQYIIKAGGNEYQRINEMVATKASFILPLNFPQAMDVEDPNDARFVSLSDLKHWEMAPTNPAAFEKAGINFALTTADLKEMKSFFPSLKKAMEYGLSESRALDALTKTPATLLGIYDKIGSLETGKLANFIITSGPVFTDKTAILQNWIQGEKYAVKDEEWNDIKGIYTVNVNGSNTSKYTLEVKGSSNANILNGSDTITAKFTYDGKAIRIGFTPEKKSKNSIRLSGYTNGDSWNGFGEDGDGNKLTWTATLQNTTSPKADSIKKKNIPSIGKVTYPFLPYGNDELPKQENLLIKNAIVWTLENEGVLPNTDVLIKAGKIIQVGKDITDPSAKIIDGTGKH
ncbi:MAG: amidohydrolase family protein, partial [Chitinophagaceae bacterium]